MAQNSKNKNTLKNLFFYNGEIKNLKRKKKNTNIELLSELPFFYKEPKELINIQLSK